MMKRVFWYHGFPGHAGMGEVQSDGLTIVSLSIRYVGQSLIFG